MGFKNGYQKVAAEIRLQNFIIYQFEHLCVLEWLQNDLYYSIYSEIIYYTIL